MANYGDSYFELLDAVTKYCDELANAAGFTRYFQYETKRLPSIARRVVPELVKNLEGGEPNAIYAEYLVKFSLRGVANPEYRSIWWLCFVQGVATKEVAARLFLSQRTVQRRMAALPEIVTGQLLRKNLELSNSAEISLSPITKQQSLTRLLFTHFGLTEREAEVLLMFCGPGAPLGRQVIAEKLFISRNTLKSHIRKIIRKIRVTTMNEAVDKARRLLKNKGLLK